MYAWFLEHSPMLAQYPQSLWPSWQFRFGFVGVGFVGVVGFEDEEHEPQEALQFADMYAWFLEHSPMLAQYPQSLWPSWQFRFGFVGVVGFETGPFPPTWNEPLTKG